MPPPGQRSPSISPRRPRSQVRACLSTNRLHPGGAGDSRLRDLLFGSMQALPTAKDRPQTPVELQLFTPYFSPTCGPVSRCSHGLKNADSAHLGPASFSPGYVGWGSEAGHCITVVVVVVIVIVPWNAVSLHPPSPLQSHPLHTSDPSQWLKGMPNQNKSHQVNNSLFLGKSWDCVQMGVISSPFPRRHGADPALVSFTPVQRNSSFSKQHLVEHLDVQAAARLCSPLCHSRVDKPPPGVQEHLAAALLSLFCSASVPTCTVPLPVSPALSIVQGHTCARCSQAGLMWDTPAPRLSSTVMPQ